MNELEPDLSAQRKLSQIKSCRCKNCAWRGSYSEYIQNHERNCGGVTRIQCKVLGCGKWLPEKRALDVHRTYEWCPMILIMKARLNHAEIVHLSMMESWDKTCEFVLSSGKKDVSELIERLELFFSVLDTNARLPSTLEIDDQSSPTIDHRQLEPKRGFKARKQSSNALNDKTARVMMTESNLRVIVLDIMKQLEAIERTLLIFNQYKEDYMRRLEMLNTPRDGVLLWKIVNYSERKRDAIKSIYSPPFFTSQYGYKLCGRVFLMGDGVGKGTHISLFLTIMRGPHDSVLPWPFNERITFQLVNQDDPINKSIVEAFRPDPASSSFKKPTTEKNIGAGCPLFAKIKMVEDPKSGFVRDNTIYLKIISQTSDVPEIK
nr:TNF receptor-associated factor 2-like [Lytechinus pictus]